MIIGEQTDSMLTIKDVARILHVHPNTLRRWADKGIIEVYRITSRGDRRFLAEDIARFLDNMKAESKQMDAPDKIHSSGSNQS